MQLDSIMHIAGMTGSAALAVFFVSQIGLIVAYRGYHLRRFGAPCDLPLFRLGATGPTVIDNIRHLEFRDPLGWGLRGWLFVYYLAQLVLALSLAAVFIGILSGH